MTYFAEATDLELPQPPEREGYALKLPEPPEPTMVSPEITDDPERDGETQERMTKEVVSSGTVGAAAMELSIESEDTVSPDKSWLQRSKERAERIGKFLGHGARLSAEFLKGVRDNPLLYGAAAVSSWVFEIGPWNETVRADVGFETFQNTFNALKTGAVVGLVTVPIEMIPATLVAWGLSRENMPGRKAMRWLHQKLGAGDKEKKSRFKAAKEYSLALGVGAAAVVAKRFFTQETNFKEEVKTAARLSLAIATFSGAVGWATVYGMLNADGTRFEGVADFLEKNGTNAKFWLAVFGGLQIAGFVGKQASNFIGKLKDGRQEKNVAKPEVTYSEEGLMQVPAWNPESYEGN